MVLMHGYSMTASDLSPFGASLGLGMQFVFPESQLTAKSGGKTWWPIDEVRRDQSLANGPRDLATEAPEGLPTAREEIIHTISQYHAQPQSKPLVLGGFSQGGMLACDVALHLPTGFIDALVLLSSSRLSIESWMPRRDRLRGLPVFISHGKSDADLAFAAGEQLKVFLDEAGACVTWLAFDGGHEIPLSVWRELKRFLKALMVAPPGTHLVGGPLHAAQLPITRE